MFLDHLYGGIDEPELKIIDVFICKLRKKIAAATGGDHYIETVWGRGYVLKDPEVQPDSQSRRRTVRCARAHAAPGWPWPEWPGMPQAARLSDERPSARWSGVEREACVAADDERPTACRPAEPAATGRAARCADSSPRRPAPPVAQQRGTRRKSSGCLARYYVAMACRRSADFSAVAESGHVAAAQTRRSPDSSALLGASPRPGLAGACQRHEALREPGRGALVLVLEEHERVAPGLCPHRAQPGARAPHRRSRDAAAAGSPSRPSATNGISELVLRLGDAQRRVMFAQQCEDLFVEPRLMAELERARASCGSSAQKVVAARQSFFKFGGNWNRSGPSRSSARPATSSRYDTVSSDVLQPLDVRDPLRRLEHEPEIGRHLARPRFQHRRLGHAIEGVVDLDRPKRSP